MRSGPVPAEPVPLAIGSGSRTTARPISGTAMDGGSSDAATFGAIVPLVAAARPTANAPAGATTGRGHEPMAGFPSILSAPTAVPPIPSQAMPPAVRATGTSLERSAAGSGRAPGLPVQTPNVTGVASQADGEGGTQAASAPSGAPPSMPGTAPSMPRAARPSHASPAETILATAHGPRPKIDPTSNETTAPSSAAATARGTAAAEGTAALAEIAPMPDRGDATHIAGSSAIRSVTPQSVDRDAPAGRGDVTGSNARRVVDGTGTSPSGGTGAEAPGGARIAPTSQDGAGPVGGATPAGGALMATPKEATSGSSLRTPGGEVAIHAPAEVRMQSVEGSAPRPATGLPTGDGMQADIRAQIAGVRLSEGRTRIELTPRGLGDIEIDLRQEGGQLRVVLRVENPAVLAGLRQDREGIAAMLRDGGVALGDGALGFESFDGHRSRGQPAPHGHAQGGGRAAGPRDEPEEPAPAPAPPDAGAVPRTAAPSSRLNLMT